MKALMAISRFCRCWNLLNQSRNVKTYLRIASVNSSQVARILAGDLGVDIMGGFIKSDPQLVGPFG